MYFLRADSLYIYRHRIYNSQWTGKGRCSELNFTLYVLKWVTSWSLQASQCSILIGSWVLLLFVAASFRLSNEHFPIFSNSTLEHNFNSAEYAYSCFVSVVSLLLLLYFPPRTLGFYLDYLNGSGCQLPANPGKKRMEPPLIRLLARSWNPMTVIFLQLRTA